MIYLVLIPAPIWMFLLASGWVILASLCYRTLAFRHVAMTAVMATMGVHAIAASSAALATSIDPIGTFACTMGTLGVWVSVGVTGLEGVALVYLSTRWPRDARGARQSFSAWVAVWLLFNLMALLAHLRSAGLCTV